MSVNDLIASVSNHCCICPDLSIDAMDVSGEHQLDVAHSVLKQRLTLDGKPIEEEPEEYQIGGEEEEGEGERKEGEGKVEREVKAVVENKVKCGRSVFGCVCEESW